MKKKFLLVLTIFVLIMLIVPSINADTIKTNKKINNNEEKTVESKSIRKGIIWGQVFYAMGMLLQPASGADIKIRNTETNEVVWAKCGRQGLFIKFGLDICFGSGIESQIVSSSECKNIFSQGIVDINKASIEELISLKGIGKAKAKAIVKYRETNGEFTSKSHLLCVKGIGSYTLRRIKDDIKI